MKSPLLIRVLSVIAVGLAVVADGGSAAAQAGPRPSTIPPASGSPSSAGGLRFAPPPAASSAERLPAGSSGSSGSRGTIGTTSSGGVRSTTGGVGSERSAIPSTSAPSGSSGGIYGGALPSTSGGSSAAGGIGATGDSGSTYGDTGGSGPAYGGSSSGGSSLGRPSSVVPRTPASGAAAGGYPYEATEAAPAAELPSGDSGGDEPAIGSRTGDAVSMNGIETKGYALIGPTAHHYIFGNLAVADYLDRGERRIVTLEQEMNLPKDDPNFLYYRELRGGNRWAIATKAGPDRRYAVYFQSGAAAAGSQPSWRRVQRARLQWSRRTGPEESMAFESP